MALLITRHKTSPYTVVGDCERDCKSYWLGKTSTKDESTYSRCFEWKCYHYNC